MRHEAVDRLFLLVGRGKQFMPRTVKPLFEPHKGCDQDVCLPSFNFLKRTDVQVGFFGKGLLGDFPRDTRTSQIPTKFFKLSLCFNQFFHKERLHKKNC